jgi:hypothetical protein
MVCILLLSAVWGPIILILYIYTIKQAPIKNDEWKKIYKNGFKNIGLK